MGRLLSFSQGHKRTLRGEVWRREARTAVGTQYFLTGIREHVCWGNSSSETLQSSEHPWPLVGKCQQPLSGTSVYMTVKKTFTHANRTPFVWTHGEGQMQNSLPCSPPVNQTRDTQTLLHLSEKHHACPCTVVPLPNSRLLLAFAVTSNLATFTHRNYST